MQKLSFKWALVAGGVLSALDALSNAISLSDTVVGALGDVGRSVSAPGNDGVTLDLLTYNVFLGTLFAESRDHRTLLIPDQVEGYDALLLDTATLRIGERLIRLEGVLGIDGAAARRMTDYVAGREVTCQPTAADRYRCDVDGWDLSEVVLFNGGGRATSTAPPELVEAEHKARAAGRGVWARH